MPRCNLPNLDVGSSGDVGVVIAAMLGEVSEAMQLQGTQFASRNPAAKHESVLGRSHMKQPLAAESEIVRFVGEFFLVGVSQQFLPDIERIFFMLPQFLFAEIR